MTRRSVAPLAACVMAVMVGPVDVRAQNVDALTKAIRIYDNYRIVPNVIYLTANNWDAKLDVYQARDATIPNRTLVYVHGGGWTGGSKEGSALTFLPFLELGWNVVNVEYRLAKVSQAPAAVEDCLCALRWVYRHAKDYNIDTTKLVTMGNSAGGHLALMMGMAPASAGLDRQCPGTEDLRVAAVINWYGITDVNDLLAGSNMKTYAVTWLGSMTSREEIATRLSPLSYVRAGIPPVITIQGDADPTVPYTHGVRLQQALDKAGVPNQHVTIPGGKHGGFTDAEMAKAYAAILSFLEKRNLIALRSNTAPDSAAAMPITLLQNWHPDAKK
jgi:acetyl esterase/lipase